MSSNVSWLVLIGSGLLEVAWASLLPVTQGFTRPAASAACIALLVASIGGLALATRTLPIGTAYAVWVGIGAVGTMASGIVMHHEPATPARLGFVLLLVTAVIGLRLTETSS